MTTKNLKKAEIQLKNAEKKLQQKQARLDDLKSRLKKQTRKDDTRRKILLGASLLAAGKKDAMAQQTITTLIATMDEQDRDLFKLDTSLKLSNAPTAATGSTIYGPITKPVSKAL